MSDSSKPLFKTSSTSESMVHYQQAEQEVMDSLTLIEQGAEISLASPPLTRDEAVVITDRIKSASETLYVLIHRAHAGKAWEAMGYSTFEEYVREEFDISRSRAYKLLAQANVIKEIETIAPPGSVIKLKEQDAKVIKEMLSEILPEIAEKTADADAENVNEIIQDILSQAKESYTAEKESKKVETEQGSHVYAGASLTESEQQSVNDSEFLQREELPEAKDIPSVDDDYDYINEDFIKELMSSSPVASEPKAKLAPAPSSPEPTEAAVQDPQTIDEPAAETEGIDESWLERELEDIDSDDRDIDMYEDEDISEDQDFEYSYALMTAVTNLRSLPEPKRIIGILPENNLEAMGTIIPKAIAWLQEFEAECEKLRSKTQES